MYHDQKFTNTTISLYTSTSTTIKPFTTDNYDVLILQLVIKGEVHREP